MRDKNGDRNEGKDEFICQSRCCPKWWVDETHLP